MKRYLFLKDEENKGLISNLERQPVYDLKGPDGKRVCRYIADFKYLRKGRQVVEDYKGAITPVFRLKLALWASNYPEQPLSVVGWDPLKQHRCFRPYQDIIKDRQARRKAKKQARKVRLKNAGL